MQKTQTDKCYNPLSEFDKLSDELLQDKKKQVNLQHPQDNLQAAQPPANIETEATKGTNTVRGQGGAHHKDPADRQAPAASAGKKEDQDQRPD